MISYVEGRLADIDEGKVIVDVNGIGYGVFVPAKALHNVPSIGKTVKLHTYLNVKEDAMQLFGFMTKDDLKIFKMVIGVSGIGPKGGLNILSTLTPDELRFAVLGDDAKTIATSPGIGKKTAEKLIIELKDKMELKETVDYITREVAGAAAPSNEAMKAQADAIEALVSLGYEQRESAKAVRALKLESEEASAEELIKLALKSML